MTRRQAQMRSWSAVALVVLPAIVGALVGRHLTPQAASQFGYDPDPEGTREFLETLEHPLFGDAAPEVMRNAKGRDTFLYRHADKASRAVYGKPFEVWNQGSIGTCVAFGWGMGSYIGQSVDWTQGEMAEPPRLVSPEAIYGGSRTAGRVPPVQFAGYSDGSYGAAAARWVQGTKAGVGGILYRQKYGSVDLTNYEIPRAKEWGNSGVPADLAKLAQQHTAQGVALCDSWQSLCAAVENGLCVPVCSNVGFAATNVRDADGFLPRGGSWAHCMVVIGVRYKVNGSPRDGALVCNSWGPNWCRGPRWPEDMPEGCFWADRKDIESILAQGDSFVIAGASGWHARDLDNGAWLEPAPAPAPGPPQPARTIAGVFSLSW
jgi:hypothetical protein